MVRLIASHELDVLMAENNSWGESFYSSSLKWKIPERAEASNLLTLALKYRRTHLGQHNELTSESIHHLAFCLEKQRRYEDAINSYQDLYDIFRACHGSESLATKEHERDLLRVRELLRHELQPGNVQHTATYHNATPNINTQYSWFPTQSTQYSSFQPSDPYYGR